MSIYCDMVGNVVRDPELSFTDAGVPRVRLSVAAHRRYQDSAGKDQEQTTFVNVNCWRGLAENVVESLHTGDRVVVRAEMTQRDYVNDAGEKRTVFDFTALRVSADVAFATVQIARIKKDDTPLPDSPPANAEFETVGSDMEPF